MSETVEHLLRLSRPRPGEPRRADAEVVGSAHAIGVVIGEVHADLQQHGDGEAEEGEHEVEAAFDVDAAALPMATGAIDSDSVRRRAAPIQSAAVALGGAAGEPFFGADALLSPGQCVAVLDVPRIGF